MSAGPRLRVLTFNIHGGRPAAGPVDLEAIAAVIRDLDPDLVALQEVHCLMPPPGVFHHQPARLAKLLDLHVGFRTSFGIGPFGYGNAILSRNRPASLRRWRLPSGREPRALLEARLEWEGRSIRFLNTHFGLREAERLRQAAAVAKRIQAEPGRVIIAGDWNCEARSREVGLITAAGVQLCGEALLTFPCSDPVCRLDYIAASPEFEVEECRAIFTEVSDHLPVLADLRLCG